MLYVCYCVCQSLPHSNKWVCISACRINLNRYIFSSRTSHDNNFAFTDFSPQMQIRSSFHQKFSIHFHIWREADRHTLYDNFWGPVNSFLNLEGKILFFFVALRTRPFHQPFHRAHIDCCNKSVIKYRWYFGPLSDSLNQSHLVDNDRDDDDGTIVISRRFKLNHKQNKMKHRKHMSRERLPNWILVFFVDDVCWIDTKSESERANEQALIGRSCETGAITHNEIWFAIHPNRYCLLFILWERWKSEIVSMRDVLDWVRERERDFRTNSFYYYCEIYIGVYHLHHCTIQHR